MTGLTERLLLQQTQDTINEEVAGLARAYQRGGLPLLVRFIEQRSRQPGANLYLIADANGRILAGNVESLEAGVLDADGWTERPFAYARYGENELRGGLSPAQLQEEMARPAHQAMAAVYRLPNQMIVLVGRDLGEPARFRDVIRRSTLVAFGMMGIGALLIWLFVGRRALRRIDGLSEASARIMGGDLAGRLPVTGAGDEFDRLSENLNAMLARIGALSDGLKQVSDNIAHDLKTPLTRLRNRAEAALAGKRTAGQYREALEGTIAESDQLIRTFNAILMISRLEAGNSAEATTQVDLAEAVRDVVELYEPVAEEGAVALTAEAPGPVVIAGNRELIGQALANVVDNAIKYSAGATAPAVALKLERMADGIALSVRDNGPGIPEADRERVTERFVRLEQSRSMPGSGLGLSLAKAVMSYHGGRLEIVDAAPGLLVRMVFPAGGRRP
ncbi:MAG: HAMP domain-containing protein [Rhizobiaceae bacterium]|nr:HAMP domain-containing protein [Rhizobiaceae bacterium]